MSKQYDYKGKRVTFNSGYFKELVDAKAKEEQCNKTWIYKEIATHLNWSVDDNTNKIFRWYKGLNAPVDLTIIQDVADYFGVDFNLLLVNQIIGKEKTMENINKKVVATPLKKVQQYELLRIKDAILDYVYDNYTSAFWEDYMSSEYGLEHDESLSLRLMERKTSFNADIYFSDGELQQIKEERALENEILMHLNSKERPDVPLLDEYRELSIEGKLYELIRKIERSLAVLPFEIVNHIMQIIVNSMPNGRDYLNELCMFNGVVSKHYSSFNDVLEPDFTLEVPDIETSNPEDDNIKRNSTYNIVMNVYKQLNELINKYCD